MLITSLYFLILLPLASASLQSTGPISLQDVYTEFGGTTPIQLSAYYRGGALVPDTPANSAIPTSGAIKLSDFYGASNNIPIDYLSSSNMHSDCTAAGGEVVSIAGDSDGTEVCRFNAATCPSGWSSAADWTTTSSTSQSWTQNSYSSESYTCSGFTETIGAISYDTGTFSSGEHSWSNTPVETDSCRTWGSTEWVSSCTNDPSRNKSNEWFSSLLRTTKRDMENYMER